MGGTALFIEHTKNEQLKGIRLHCHLILRFVRHHPAGADCSEGRQRTAAKNRSPFSLMTENCCRFDLSDFETRAIIGVGGGRLALMSFQSRAGDQQARWKIPHM
jgi:hypothetical protein